MYATMTRRNANTDRFRDSLGRLIDQSFNEFLAPVREASRPWAPPVDIRVTESELIFVSDLPGLTREDVTITLENNVLTISGERRAAPDVEREAYHRRERVHGTFSRSFSLPTNVQVDQTNATFRDGVLTITVPKVEAAKPRRITIE